MSLNHLWSTKPNLLGSEPVEPGVTAISSVVLDNDWKTWKAFGNLYWPHKFIADYEGHIRYDHIGEGNYDETEKVIQELLRERATQLGLQTAGT